jgi:hypothetical protein
MSTYPITYYVPTETKIGISDDLKASIIGYLKENRPSFDWRGALSHEERKEILKLICNGESVEDWVLKNFWTKVQMVTVDFVYDIAGEFNLRIKNELASQIGKETSEFELTDCCVEGFLTEIPGIGPELRIDNNIGELLLGEMGTENALLMIPVTDEVFRKYQGGNTDKVLELLNVNPRAYRDMYKEDFKWLDSAEDWPDLDLGEPLVRIEDLATEIINRPRGVGTYFTIIGKVDVSQIVLFSGINKAEHIELKEGMRAGFVNFAVGEGSTFSCGLIAEGDGKTPLAGSGWFLQLERLVEGYRMIEIYGNHRRDLAMFQKDFNLFD